MPYLATPPGPPPTVVSPSAKDVSHPNLPPVAAAKSTSAQSLKPGNLPTLDTPEVSPEFSSAPLLKNDFIKQSGEARANLLEEPSAEEPPIGYLGNAEPQVDYKLHTSTIASLAKPTVKFDPTNRVPQLASAKSNKQTSASSTTGFYSLAGLTKKPTPDSEVELMGDLSQSIVVDKLSEDLSASGLTIETPQMRLNLLSQQVEPVQPALPNSSSDQPSTGNGATPGSSPNTTPAEQKPKKSPNRSPAANPSAPKVIELRSDRQEYDQNHKIFTAEGRVTMRYTNGLLDADRVQANLNDRIVVAEGNVALTRGSQVLRGQRLVYNFVQGVGTIFNARGEINTGTINTDFASSLPSDVGAATPLGPPVSDRVTAAQPLRVTDNGGAFVNVGFGRNVSRIPGALPRGGKVKRLRFEAEQVDFTPEGWVAKKIQITNDPFSPPQLLLKADEATLTRLSPLQDELKATHPRLVFDQRVSLPIPLTRTIINRGERQPPLFQFGFDDRDKGGFFVQHPFELISTPQLRLSVAPQILLQRAVFDSSGPLDPDNFGAIARLSYVPGPRTIVRGFASLSSFDINKFSDELRASLRATQKIGTHTLALEYSYRNRLFNGSLGFQTVQSSVGALFLSPRIQLGNSGVILTYQTGFQYINSETDRLDLLGSNPDNNRVSLGRFQASAALTRGFTLWQGKPLPATPDAGLKYTPRPIVPYISVGLGLTGVSSAYTNGDTQNNLTGSIGLYGQFGHFSRPFFDYTAFSLTYIQVVDRGQSPFLFDRVVDNRILIAGITQQIYGPIRATVQTALNLDTKQEISTDFIVEYSRRAYGIILRYNPVLSIGSLGFRISDFNWTGGTEPFEDSDITPVESGIRRINNQ